MSSKVEIDREVLQLVLDAAYTGDSYASGWLDDEQVAALRACALALGVDPMGVTPANFRCKYRGGHVWSHPYRPWPSATSWLIACKDCRTARQVPAPEATE